MRTPRPADPPIWVARAAELDLPIKWANTYVAAAGATLTTAEALARESALPAAAITSFRALASESGVVVPDGNEAGAQLQHLLMGFVAYVKWGNPGLYVVEARIDPAVRDAMKQFGRFSGRP